MKRSSCASGRGYVPSCSIGFCVASTKNGAGKGWVCPAAVTWCSCIAWSSAAWVLGGVRFTSSASTIFANTGPRTNRNANIVLADEVRSEEHTSELQSQSNLVCRLLLEKKKKKTRK